MKKEKQYPLIKEGYDVLDCPNCDKTCYPDAKGADGTIIYNLHKCKNVYEFEAQNLRFEIDIEGDIVEP